jgi:hypothetical protein
VDDWVVAAPSLVDLVKLPPPVAAHVPRTRTLAATIPNLRCRRMIRSSDEPALAASCQLGEDIA